MRQRSVATKTNQESKRDKEGEEIQSENDVQESLSVKASAPMRRAEEGNESYDDYRRARRGRSVRERGCGDTTGVDERCDGGESKFVGEQSGRRARLVEGAVLHCLIVTY